MDVQREDMTKANVISGSIEPAVLLVNSWMERGIKSGSG